MAAMRAVLRGRCGYYGGTYQDKFYNDRVRMVDTPQEAFIYEVLVEEGAVCMRPKPPEGDWDVVPVRVRVDEQQEAAI